MSIDILDILPNPPTLPAERGYRWFQVDAEVVIAYRATMWMSVGNDVSDPDAACRELAQDVLWEQTWDYIDPVEGSDPTVEIFDVRDFPDPPIPGQQNLRLLED